MMQQNEKLDRAIVSTLLGKSAVPESMTRPLTIGPLICAKL